jgi:PAS domain S-box-containing protein
MPFQLPLFEAIVNSISNGLYVIQGGRALFLNPRMAEIFGYDDTAPLLSRDMYGEVYPDAGTVDIFRQANQQALKAEAGVVAWGQPCARTDGTYFWMEVEARRIEVDGRPAVFGTILDRTDCKMIGEAMHVSQETLRLLFDAMEDRVYVVTDDYKLVYANRKMKEGLLGDMELDPCYRACRGLEKECDDCSMVEVFQKGSPLHKEFLHQGVNRWFSVIELPIRMPGISQRTKLAVARDVTSRKEAEEKIRALTHRLLTAQEEEKRHLSRELHDDLGQRLNAVKMGLEGVKNHCINDDCELARQAGRLCTILDDSIDTLRTLSWGLRPPSLERLGLVDTIGDHCRRLADIGGLQVDIRTAGLDGVTLSSLAEINLFRIIQEALHNVMKHADSRNATVRLVASHPRLIVKIQDEGQGFDPSQTADQASGLGIVGMKERVDILGGEFDIQSAPGKGTRITIDIPIEEAGAGRRAKGERKSPAKPKETARTGKKPAHRT